MKTIGQILEPVTARGQWCADVSTVWSGAIRLADFDNERSPRRKADADFAVRAAVNFEPLVLALEAIAGDTDDCVSPGMKSLARAALNAALQD